MYGHVARQPIFDKNLNIFGYELLFRDGALTFPTDVSGDTATSELLSSTFLTSDIYTYTGIKKAFVNFTRNHLVNRIPLLFPREITVVEILEDVSPEADVVAACQEIAQKGFTIALDDFVYRPEIKPLIALCDIVKIDFRSTSPERISAYFNLLSRDKKRMLAEKVETYEEFKRGRDMGFQYFQGYFFARPEVIQGRTLSTPEIHLLRLMAAVHGQELDFDQIEDQIKRDITLSYKLLRYINSAYFHRLQEITAIKQAILLLGEVGIRRFISLMAMAKLAKGKPQELANLSAIRARFCECLGSQAKLNDSAGELFTVGLFSLIDAIMDDTMESILQKLPFAKNIKEALLGQGGPLGDVLKIAIAYERGGWQDLSALCARVGIPEEALPPLYRETLEWGQVLDAP
ncbi:MAG: HDOD domain-containing protein [Desulfobacterales bacterium]|jgi:EAL and modified HD-GYP domain-containing signal transduction protein|nr:HDOD domain-containing protein [Desulfobacterales bacterium]